MHNAGAMQRPTFVGLLEPHWLASLLALLLVIVQASAGTTVADTQPYEINALRAQVCAIPFLFLLIAMAARSLLPDVN